MQPAIIVTNPISENKVNGENGAQNNSIIRENDIKIVVDSEVDNIRNKDDRESKEALDEEIKN